MSIVDILKEKNWMYYHDVPNERWRILAWDLDRTFLPIKAARDLLAPIIPVIFALDL
jgi:hypothetical protein